MEIYSTYIKSFQHLKVSENLKNLNFVKQSSKKVYDSDVLSVGVPETVRQKATTIRRIASLGIMGDQFNFINHHITIVLKVLRPLLCREELVSETRQRM